MQYMNHGYDIYEDITIFYKFKINLLVFGANFKLIA